jgi:hypothetical protein
MFSFETAALMTLPHYIAACRGVQTKLRLRAYPECRLSAASVARYLKRMTPGKAA